MADSNLAKDEEEALKRIKALQDKTDKLKKAVANGIEKIIDQGPDIEDLQQKTEDLAHMTSVFKKVSKKVEEVEKEEELKTRSYLLGVCGASVGLIYGFFTGVTWPVSILLAGIGGVLSFGVTEILADVEISIDRFVNFSPIEQLWNRYSPLPDAVDLGEKPKAMRFSKTNREKKVSSDDEEKTAANRKRVPFK